MTSDTAREASVLLPETYASGVPYELFRELRATSPVC